MSHHSQEIFEQQHSAEFSKQFKDMFSPLPNIGATGKFPDGKINEKDEGELQFAMTVSDGRLIMNFGKPVAWIGFEKEQVEELISYLTKKLCEM
jgi:hypothetical protein